MPRNGRHVFTKGAFLNYVDKILPIIDHVATTCDIWEGIPTRIVNFYKGKSEYRWHFQYHLPTSSCQRSLWMPPNLIRYINTFFDLYIPNTLIQNLTTFFISFFITVIFMICSKLTFMLLFCEYSHSKLIDLLKTFTVTYLAFESNIFFDLKLYTYPQHTYLLRFVFSMQQ